MKPEIPRYMTKDKDGKTTAYGSLIDMLGVPHIVDVQALDGDTVELNFHEVTEDETLLVHFNGMADDNGEPVFTELRLTEIVKAHEAKQAKTD